MGIVLLGLGSAKTTFTAESLNVALGLAAPQMGQGYKRHSVAVVLASWHTSEKGTGVCGISTGAHMLSWSPQLSWFYPFPPSP